MYSVGSTPFPSPFVSRRNALCRLQLYDGPERAHPPSGHLFVCLPCRAGLSSGTKYPTSVHTDTGQRPYTFNYKGNS